MDTENKPAVTDKSAELWRLILMAGGALGVILVIVILALQVMEFRFYKASPDVWPQPGAGGAISEPAQSAPEPAKAAAAEPATVSTSAPVAKP